MHKRKITDNVNTLEKKTRIYSIPKQNFINYISIPPLETVTSANIVISLWKCNFQETLLNFLLKQSPVRSIYEKEFDNIVSKVSNELLLLPLPKLLKEELLSYTRPVGLEIVNCLTNDQQYRRSYSPIEQHFRKHFDSICWKMNGTIDKAKTLTTFLSFLGYSNVEYTYKFICQYCVEDDIRNSWDQMSENSRTLMDVFGRAGSDNPLMAYWTLLIKDEQSELLSILKQFNYRDIYNCEHSINVIMFTSSIFKGNVKAAKHFYPHLTDEELYQNILLWTCFLLDKKRSECIGLKYQNTNGFADCLFFLLSQMKDNEQQREILQKYSDVILKSLFFNWPYQKFLLPTLQVMWDYLPKVLYVDLLKTVIGELKDGRNTQMLLRKLWCKSPEKFKNYFIEYLVVNTLDTLCYLFKIKDFETVNLIVSDADEESKKILCSTKSNILDSVIHCGKLPELENFIRKVGYSTGDINNIKEAIALNYGSYFYYEGLGAGNWQEWDKFIVWTFNSQDKINSFKTTMMTQIIESGYLHIIGFVIFKKLAHWCFDSNEKIDNFKKDISSYKTMQSIILPFLKSDYLEFPEQLLVWCFSSKKKICQFKNKLMLSGKGIDVFKARLKGNLVPFSDYIQESVLTLSEWFYPFERDVLIEFEQKFRQSWISDGGDMDSFAFLIHSLNDIFDKKMTVLAGN